jgi:ATP-dependent RNA helicase SUPV3L1/SUV3
LESDHQTALRRRLSQWLGDQLARDLAPLLTVRAASERAEISGPLRGILFQITEGLGAVPRADVTAQVAALDGPARKELARLGARLGVLHLFLPGLFMARAIQRRALLWRIHRGGDPLPDLPRPLLSGKPIVKLKPESDLPADLARALGYMRLGPRALRLDQAERLAAETRKLARQGPFTATPDLIKLAGAENADLANLLEALGYRGTQQEAGMSFAPRKPGKRQRGRPPRRKSEGAAKSYPKQVAHNPTRPSDSPFAQLGEMLQAHHRTASQRAPLAKTEPARRGRQGSS